MLFGGRIGHPAWGTLRQYRYAHRGYHDKPQIPENSLPAFRRAAARGWGAELDVHLLRDGTLAVFHDSDLKRCTGAEGTIEALNRAELDSLRLEGTGEHVPLFDQVLDIFEHTAPLIIEIKTYQGNHRAVTEAVCRRLDSYRGAFCIESFDPRCLMDLRKLRPDICRGQLAEDFGKNGEALSPLLRFALTNLWFNVFTKPDFIAYKYEDRANRSLRRCITSGVQEVHWTIRSEADMAQSEQEGAMVIFERFDPDSVSE